MKRKGTFLLIAAFLWCVAAMTASASEPVNGTKVFNRQGFGYVLQYPDGWLYYTEENHTAIFIGKTGEEKNNPSVMIKSLLAASHGGAYTDVEGIIRDLENQLRVTKNAVVYNPESFTYKRDGLNLKGARCVTEYVIKNQKFKQWTVVIPRKNNNAFYFWAYTAPEAVYDVYFPVAKAMFDSWVMKD